MRWDDLFASLEARFDELADASMTAERAERERLAVGAVPMTARLAGAVGGTVRVHTTAGGPHAGTLLSIGPDWLLLGASADTQVLIALAAVAVVDGLTARTGQAPAGIAVKLDLRRALRGLTRDRAAVSITVAGGNEWTGTIDRIGADFAEVALHAPWEPRRAGGVRSVVLIPIGSMVSVAAAPWG